jgi:membrane-bound metal-dependent hydrolase YbcI (DUF457 family)
MTYAFGHLVGAWIVGKISKIKSSYTWFFLLLGSLIPDADYLIDWTLHTNIHRTITHSFFFLIIAPFFLYLILTIIKDSKNKEFSLAFAIGIFTHYMLDMFFHHGIPLFWPHPFHFSYYGFGYPSTKLSASFDYSVSFLKKWLKIAILDMAIGSSWIFYLLLRRKIKF